MRETRHRGTQSKGKGTTPAPAGRTRDGQASTVAVTDGGAAPAEAVPVLERAILSLLEARPPGRTICPSEAARAAARALGDAAGWRALMVPTRSVAAQLVAAGRIDILQRGCVAGPGPVRGPVRLRLRAPVE